MFCCMCYCKPGGRNVELWKAEACTTDIFDGKHGVYSQQSKLPDTKFEAC